MLKNLQCSGGIKLYYNIKYFTSSRWISPHISEIRETKHQFFNDKTKKILLLFTFFEYYCYLDLHLLLITFPFQ